MKVLFAPKKVGISFFVGLVVSSVAFTTVIVAFVLIENKRRNLNLEPAELSMETLVSRVISEDENGDNERFDIVHLNLLDTMYDRSRGFRRVISTLDVNSFSKFWDQLEEIDDRGMKFLARRDFVRYCVRKTPRDTLRLIQKLPWIEREALIESFFVDMAMIDFKHSLSLLTLLDTDELREALTTLLYAQKELSPKEMQTFASKHGHPEVVSVVRKRLLLDLAEEFPFKAYTEIGDSNISRTDQNYLSQLIIEHWVDQSGELAIEQISVLSQSLESHDALTLALQHFALTAPARALEIAQSFSPNRRASLLAGVYRGWAKIAPKAALTHLNASKEIDSKSAIFSEILNTLVRADPNELLAHIELFPTELHSWAVEQALIFVSKSDPEEAAQFIATRNDRISSQLALQIVNNWAKVDIDRALAWINNQYVGDNRQFLLEAVVTEIASIVPNRALQIAKEEPTDRFNPGLEFDVIDVLARHDVEKAKILLPEVRGGVTKLSCYGAVGFALVRQGKIADAFALGNELPDNMRDFFYGGLVGDWSIFDPKGLLLAIDEVPTTKAKSRAAVWLLGAHQDSAFLSDDEFEFVRTLLSEADIRAVDF